jgi:hypothetical protein
MSAYSGDGAPRRRSALATTARAFAVLVIAMLVIVAGAWAGSKLMPYDDRLAMVSAVPAGFGVGLLTIAALRARNGFIAGPLLSTVLAVSAGSHLLRNEVLAYGSFPDLAQLGTYDGILVIAGTAAALLSVVCAAVSGHLHPRAPAGAVMKR